MFLENNEKYKNSVLKAKIFGVFERNAKLQKKAKGNIKRVLIRLQRNLEYRAISSWKEYSHNSRINKIKIQIKELDQEYSQHSKEIKELNNQIESTLSQNSHLSNRLLSQAKRIIMNTFTRRSKSNLSNSFSLWKSLVVRSESRVSALRACYSHWRKKHLYEGLRKWSRIVYSIKRSEISTKIDLQITENAKIKALIEQEEIEYTEKVIELNSQAEVLEKERERHK